MTSLYRRFALLLFAMLVLGTALPAQTLNKFGESIPPAIAGPIPRLEARNGTFLTDLHAGPYSGNPESMARSFLLGRATQLGMRSDLADISVSAVQESPAGRHVRFFQTVNGIPVHQGDLVVSIDQHNFVEFLSSNYRSGFTQPAASPELTRDQAVTLARERLGVTGTLFGEITSELRVVVEKGIGRLGYRVTIPAFQPRGDWEVFVDAVTGEVFSIIDQAAYYRQPGDERKKPDFAPFAKFLPTIPVRQAIQDLVNQVDVVAVTATMRRMQSFKTRYVSNAEGRDSLARARDWLVERLQSFGYTDIVQHNFTYGGNTLQNIVVTKTGTRAPDTMVVIGGHYDCVNTTGADDNGSGTSLVLEVARVLAQKKFEYTIKFIFFSAEEQGLIGSQAYVQNVAVPGSHKIKLMINADMIGYSGGGSIVKVERDNDASPPGNNAASALCTDTLAALTELYSTLTTQISTAYASDYMSFEDAGYAITGFFEDPENPHYHTPSDSLVYVDTSYVAEIVKGATAGVAHFARVTSGSGLPFDPDPLTTAHAAYTDPGYGDNNDADSPQLSAQRQLRTLPDLTFSGGVYQLQGPFAYIEDWDSPTSAPVTAANPDSFRYNREQQGFEDVNVYFHIDNSQRHIQSLGFTNVQNLPFHLDPHGFSGDDNSAYYPSTNKITYGEGGVDDAEDADVVLHEYGHAIHNGSVPGWSGSGEQGSLGEGFGDYWAESYSRRFNMWQPSDPAYNWVFGWDGHNTAWAGRITNYTAHYPEGLTGTIHTDGQMWGSTLMSIWNELGYLVLDKLVLQSHFYLTSSGVTMTQNAQAVIQADRNLFGGSHVQTLVYWFGQRGFINPADYIPSIVHTPRGDSENPLGPYPVTATVYAGGSPIDTNYVRVFWGRGALTDSVDMVRTANPNEWTANIPGNGSSATYQYYVKVKDVTGAAATSPAGAPANYHTFYVGDDLTAPAIVHTPLRNQPKLRWPPVVRATVTDNLGVDSVWAEFSRVRGGLTGSFELLNTTGATYEAPFALDSSEVQFGDSIYYRIVARDISSGHNTTMHPPAGYHTFEIINTRGVVLVVDDDASTKNETIVEGKDDAGQDALMKGIGGRLIARTLNDAGYVVDTVSFASHDPATYPSYDIVIWSGGVKGSGVFGDAAKRTALINRALGGGKIIVEGGEVGYVYRLTTSELDPIFRRIVLHDSSWLSDVTSSTLVVTQPAHPIYTVPNTITGPISFTGTTVTVRDAMRLIPSDPGAYKIGGWSTYAGQGPDTAGFIVYDNNPNPLSAQIVFMPFSVGNITDTTTGRKLIENTAEYLLTNEPPPSGGLSGVVNLSDVPDWSGVKVVIQGISLPYRDSLVTNPTGSYQFNGLYTGTYRISVSKPGYYPGVAARDSAVSTTLVTGFDFFLTPVLPTTVSGVALLADTTVHSGITVAIVGQGLTTTTDSAGAYIFTNVGPGPLTILASKAGYRTVAKDTTVANGGSLTVNFLLDVQTVLLSESFESGTALPPGWSTVVVTPGTTAPAWTIITGAGTNPAAPPYSGSNQAKFNSYSSTAGSQARLTSLRLMTPVSGLRMTFFMYHDPGYTTNYDSITVQATTGDSITGPWTRLGSYIRYAATAAWRKDSVDLTPFNGQAKVYVSFLATSRYGNNMYLDEINITQYSVAGSISGIAYEDVDGDGTRDGGEPALTGWKMFLSGGKTDSTITDGTGAYTFTNLNPDTFTVTQRMEWGWTQLLPAPPAGHTVVLGIGQNVTGQNFASYREATISGRIFEDMTADSISVDDVTPGGWTFYLNGPSSDTSLSESAGFFDFAHLPPGTYTITAKETTGWLRTFPASGIYTVTAQSGQTVPGQFFGFFRKGSVAGVSWKDINGNGVKESGEPALSNWTIQVQGTTHSPVNVQTDTDGKFTVGNLEFDTYTVSQVPQSGYTGTYPPGGNHVVGLHSGLDTTGLDFGYFYPDTAMYRTFTGPAVATALDDKGKMGKSVKRKANKVQFAFDLIVPAGTPSLTLEFSMDASGRLTQGGDSIASFTGKKPAPMMLPVVAGETVRVAGMGLKGKVIKAKYAWGSAKKVTVPSFVLNVPKLPMPNELNLLEDLFKQGAFSSTQGLIAGKVLTGTDALRYGWVQIGSYKDALKSLLQKGAYHTGPARTFDFAGTKPILGRQKSLPPTKHNNALFGEMLALKLNIFASAADMTPVGFGDLTYDDGSGSALCGMSILGIAAAVDSFLTYNRLPAGLSADSLLGVVRGLNTAFSGPMDTTAFGTGMKCPGVRKLSEVPVLHPDLVAEPFRISLNEFTPSGAPAVFRLQQNYPNPFNPTTMISFELPSEAFVTLKVYDILGREVATLFDHELMDDGDHEMEFDGSGLASGMYFYRLVADVPGDDFDGESAGLESYTSIRKLMLVK